MGNFLVIVPTSPDGMRRFDAGVDAARRLKQQIPRDTVTTPWARAAAFPRQNGSGGRIVCDPQTGSWLLASGTWFHSANPGLGDESVLLKRYREAGAQQLAAELEGFFVLVVADGRSREVNVITDVAGSCHCFIRNFTDAVAISGSSLLLAGLGDFSLDVTACQEYLRTGIIYQDRTLFKEVRKLGPARIFRFANGELKGEEQYWNARQLEPDSLAGEAAVEQLWNALNGAASAVAKRFGHPVCDLTGGYDSRAMLAAFLPTSARLGTTVSGRDEDADVIVSRTIAQAYNLPHQQFLPTAPAFEKVAQAAELTDAEYDPVDYARTMQVHQALAKQFDISINGSYGEIARGYWWELLVPNTGKRGKLDSRKLAQARYGASDAVGLLFPPDQRLDIVSHFARVVDESNAGLYATPNTFQMDHAYLTMRMQRWQGRIASSTNQVWPCLSPFMFRPVLGAMMEARPELRKRSLMIRQMLARYQPKLANFPLEHGYPAVPANLKNLPRFLPLLHYYAERVKSRLGMRAKPSASIRPARLELWQVPEVVELLRPEKMKTSGLLDASALRDFLLRSREENFAHGAEWQRLLGLEYILSRLSS
jgi:asparagine synthase (glutamine-hydrolysing)